jgi:hypothetical protein
MDVLSVSYLQFGRALSIPFTTTNTSSMDVHGVSLSMPVILTYRVYPFAPASIWTCRVCPFPQPTEWSAGCIPFKCQIVGLSGIQ